ncbi:MAG: tetratricopeptide repeat protein, partial [Chitinispirillia bacterium]
MLKIRDLLFIGIIGILISNVFGDETFDNLYNAGKYKDAIKYADQKIPPASRDAALWVKIAQANEKAGYIEKALASYMVSWRMNPKDYASLLGAARIYNNLKQHENAMDMAKKALEQQFSGEASWEYAKACIALKKPAEAKRALEKVIETDPTNDVANRELGIIYFKDGQYQKAIPLLKKSFDKKADENVSLQIGKSYLKTGDKQSAITYLKKATDMNPSLYEAHLDLARAHYEINQYEDAVSFYSKIDGKISFIPNDYFYYAKSLYETGNKEKAVKIYKKAIEKSGSSKTTESIVAHHMIGLDALSKKQYSNALKYFLFIEKADPKAMVVKDIYFLQSEAYMGMKKTTEAIGSLEKAIAIDSKNIEAYARLADLYAKNNMSTKAKETYEKMMSLSPNDPDVYLFLGNYSIKAKKYKEALDLFIKSNSLKNTPAALEGIAISAAALNQWDRARDAAESAVGLDETLNKSRVILVEALLKVKNYKDARIHLEYLILRNPSSLKYWLDLAKCYESLGDNEKLAEADLKITQLDKKNVDSRMRLAKYNLNKGNKDDAYSTFKELSALKPNDPNIFKNLFIIARDKKENANAIAFLKKYLKLNPKDAEHQKILGDFLYEKKELNGALSAYRKAIEIDPGIKGFYKRYAEIVIAKGQQDEVIVALNNVIKSGEADIGTYSTLGMIHKEKGNYKSAIEMYQKALMIEPQNGSILISLGDCQTQFGNISEAVISYEQAVMMDPKAVKVYKSLGNLYSKQKKTDQAMKAYEKYLDEFPNDQSISKEVGDYFYVKKDYEKAARYLSKVKGKQSQDFNHLLRLCESSFNSKDYKNTIIHADNLLKKGPKVETRKTILKMKAESLEKTDKIAAALLTYDQYSKIKGVRDADIDYKRAFLREKTKPVLAQNIYLENIKLYPTDSRNYMQLGLLYSKNKATLSKAAPMLEKAAATAGKDQSLWLEIAKIYGQLGEVDKELDAYKKYVDIDPKNLEANIRIGSILMDRDMVSEGMVYLEMANTYSPNNVEVMAALAKGYIKTKRLNEGIQLLEKAKSLKPDDTEIRKDLLKAYSETGRRKEALVEIKELLDKERDMNLLLLYAKMLLAEGRTKDAESAIEDIMAVNPENIDALMLLAEAQRKRKKYDEAIETYKEIIYIDANYAPALFE